MTRASQRSTWALFVPALVDTYTVWEGTQYGLPWLGDAMILPYNTEHFKAAGLDPAVPPKNWDEVIEFGKKLTKGDQYGFALMGGRQAQAMCTYSAILFSYGTKFYDDAGKPQFATRKRYQGDEHHLATGAHFPAVGEDVGDRSGRRSGCPGRRVDGNPVARHPGRTDRSAEVESHRQDGVRPATGARPAGRLGHRHLVVVQEQGSRVADDELPDHASGSSASTLPKGYAITAKALFTDPRSGQGLPVRQAIWRCAGHRLFAWPRTADTNEVVDIMAKHINSVVVGDEKPDDGAKAMNQEVEDLRRERGLIKS